jgi:DNA polymerase III alpha subunit (gram-positive type)
MPELIFVDTESTGLADDPDAVMWELSWGRREGEVKTLWFGRKEVPAFIDDLTGFTKRGCAGKRSTHFEVEEFLAAAKDNTIVAANPSHDKHFIQLAGLWNFHYRMLDVESYAMKALDLDYMPGMKNIYDELEPHIGGLVMPDHSSRNDVLAMRQAFLFMEKM